MISAVCNLNLLFDLFIAFSEELVLFRKTENKPKLHEIYVAPPEEMTIILLTIDVRVEA